MAGRNCADIVFCIDASGSMQPAIDAVRENISRLLHGLAQGGDEQGYSWDVRFDFLAFHNNREGIHSFRSVRADTVALHKALYLSQDSSPFFTRDVQEFCRALAKVRPEDEEKQLLALDFALDFPWRPSADCHRVVVLLTDEGIESALAPEDQKAHIPALVEKLMEKRIKLFIIAPESEGFYTLAEADRCEYNDLDTQGTDGLRGVDFSKMLESIGKSVSVSQTYDGGRSGPRPLFGQQAWGVHEGPIHVNAD